MTEQEALVALNGTPGYGPRKTQKLLQAFGSARAAFGAGEKEFAVAEGLGKAAWEALHAGPAPGFVAEQFTAARTHNARIVTLADPEYPARLKTIFDPPIVIYVQGLPLAHTGLSVGVVGTRTATQYGRKVARDMSLALAAAGVCVVSGLARGIDTVAHMAALAAKGRTIAVLGCGLDYVFLDKSEELLRGICASGALVSEFPFGTPPEPGHFPRRNRIISGLSHGVLVIEAGKKSGALITAEYAMEQGIDVFAVPGNITSAYSEGANRLIRDGAHAALSADDVLFTLGKRSGQTAAPQALNLGDDEKKVLDILEGEPMHIDAIIRKSALTVAALHPILMSLEIKGVVAQLSGMKYTRA
ncbi:MAG: DNA protecting protein DprA [Candidatus Raymondbacteria bacterium RifOxyA12_full_50_37]|uniref:DNA protecting protein DprA n=1 Tax=Candidatus Raymondbacteria bacterium RIFOXYD12_FULL_49_13 TaxID=1817890 RepID=A0A1F7FKH9_UNCRA|nr:MAG: DNA protecting protein DprA [Candidatus Raymondbacteria bacterium RifOxyA12_full_50_37]OGJ90833.1 MAG: DNA protecting protein DprA [Candidatus Raymondbacteria bacterium RIFOXYA2_FULL_49_16]OGJ98641.1 MAG: DNA protecting protein DprA [Candidatus Raymondbacteria bacterium RIFOXYC2_FULL_50_21]OGK00407.1 MAG: DNA protecting protein DprA [Candidatus Raymondbacteria bacterium RifOxyB12_full_50_8]OGK05245.1 MAG: DNA protecting protein DprA [Candidatus Raymondbacteria bacterium RifOxyC12_full_5